MHTDAKSRKTERGIKGLALAAMRGRAPLLGPLEVVILITRTPPKSWTKSERLQAHFITGKPDCDNSAKLVCDAFNAVVWRDDSQISDLRIQRRYSLTDPERTYVAVTKLVASGSLI